MNPLSKNGAPQTTSSSIYHKEIGGFYRVKSVSDQVKAVDVRITHYIQDSCLSSRPGASVYSYKSQEEGKEKIIKYTENLGRAEDEYETTLKWPQGATGLLLRPKGFLTEPDGEFFIMHKYDGNIPKFLPQLKEKERIEAICQLSQGLATMHDLRMTHGDIHPWNLLYDKNKNRFDLADFEHVRIFESEDVDSEEFKIKIEEDLGEFKICIETIIMGKVNSSHERELNSLEDILKCGFDLESSKLILNFMNSDIKSAHEILQCFTEIKNILQKSTS